MACISSLVFFISLVVGTRIAFILKQKRKTRREENLKYEEQLHKFVFLKTLLQHNGKHFLQSTYNKLLAKTSIFVQHN